MKNKTLNFGIVIFLITMLFILTGCSNNNNDIVDINVENINNVNEKIINNNINDLSEKDNKAEDKLVLEVGDYTLQYGDYIGTESQYDDSGIIITEIILSINQDGTYNLKSSNTSLIENSNGTYKVEKNTYQGVSSDYILSLSNGSFYIVTDNNTIQVPAGSGAKFVYQEKNI